MLVKDVMHADVVTIGPRASLADALELMRQNAIRHLPVVDRGVLVGIVSDRDLKRSLPSGPNEVTPALGTRSVDGIMTRPVITTGLTVSIEEAGRVMVSQKISALPVTEAGRLVGIVTETDVVTLLIRALGVAEPSSRLDVRFEPRGSALADITRTVEETGVSIVSIVTLTGEGGREAILRLATIDPRRVVAALERKGYVVRDAHRPPGVS